MSAHGWVVFLDISHVCWLPETPSEITVDALRNDKAFWCRLRRCRAPLFGLEVPSFLQLCLVCATALPGLEGKTCLATPPANRAAMRMHGDVGHKEG